MVYTVIDVCNCIYHLSHNEIVAAFEAKLSTLEVVVKTRVVAKRSPLWHFLDWGCPSRRCWGIDKIRPVLVACGDLFCRNSRCWKEFQFDLRLDKQPISSGCSLSVVFCGSFSRTTPSLLAVSIVETPKCCISPSKMIRSGRNFSVCKTLASLSEKNQSSSTHSYLLSFACQVWIVQKFCQEADFDRGKRRVEARRCRQLYKRLG